MHANVDIILDMFPNLQSDFNEFLSLYFDFIWNIKSIRSQILDVIEFFDPSDVILHKASDIAWTCFGCRKTFFLGELFSHDFCHDLRDVVDLSRFSFFANSIWAQWRVAVAFRVYWQGSSRCAMSNILRLQIAVIRRLEARFVSCLLALELTAGCKTPGLMRRAVWSTFWIKPSSNIIPLSL